jgi:hypothetical protein
MIPVEGHKGLYRDQKTNAIVNNNDNEYSDYIKLKNSKLKERSEIDEIKNEISEIKSLLFELLNKNN